MPEPGVQIILVYLFGHYDSRGGTTGVTADSEQDAKEQYSAMLDADMEYADADYMGQATLEIPGDVQSGVDLEDMGTVALEGGWPEDNVFSGQRIRLYPSGSDLPPGWTAPEWNDDAYGFILIY